MNFVKYLGKIIGIIFRSPFEKTDLISGIIGAAISIFAFYKPNFAPFLGLIAGATFFGIFLGVIVYRIIFAPYWVYRDELDSRVVADTNLEKYRRSLPNLVVDQIRDAPMHVESQVQQGRRRIFRVAQVWFRNEPEFPSSESLAGQISARIEFWDAERESKLFEIHGQWAISTAPDHVGYSEITPAIDLAPGTLYGKLFVALKYDDDLEAYAYSQESLGRSGDGRDENVVLEPGRYKVYIALEGLRIRSDYWLTLTNPGVGEILQLETE